MQTTLIDVMGDDLRVANAARVSFSKTSYLVDSDKPREDELGTSWYEMTGEKSYYQVLSEADQKLISYLAKHNHWTPFSHVQITMREKVPIFVARQRFKHVVGFSYNEVSRRYVDDEPEFFHPKEWRGKPVNAKQGSSNQIMEEPYIGRRIQIGKYATDWTIDYKELMFLCTGYYNKAIEQGVAPEQARMVLPQSMYTEYYVTGSLAAWARAYKLRIDPHAQKEIQELAEQWHKIISGIEGIKYSWSALIES